MGVVGLEGGGNDFAVFDGFAVPALFAEGVDDGVELSGDGHVRGR